MASNTSGPGQSPATRPIANDDEPAGGTIDVRQESTENQTVAIEPTRTASPPPPGDADDGGGTVDVSRGSPATAPAARNDEPDVGSGTVDLSGHPPADREDDGGTVDLSRVPETAARTSRLDSRVAGVESDESGGTVDVSHDTAVNPPASGTPGAAATLMVEASGTIDSVATGATKVDRDAPTKLDQSKQSAAGASVDRSKASRTDPAPATSPKQFEQRRPLRPESTARDMRHTVTRFLAEGGLGKVFVAQDTDLNREVVLKTLKPETAKNADAKKRFVKEAQVNAQLEHPNIIPIYQAGKNPDDNQPYYTMKFIRGKELADLIKQYHEQKRAGNTDPLQFRTLLGLFTNACYALSYAHHRGVVHRDLKPGNIAVGEFGELIVLDWGLAKVLGEVEEVEEESAEKTEPGKDRPADSPRRVAVTADADTGLTMKGRIMGTPGYMAPEQAAGKIGEIGPAADIYGLGGILFEILTGEPPHKLIHKYEQDKIERWSRRDTEHMSKVLATTTSVTGTQLKENTMDMLGRIVAGAVPAPRDIEPTAPLALEAVVKKAMRLDAKERYADAKEIAEDVARWLADEPVSVHRDTWQDRLGRWMRKNRLKVQVGFLAAVAIITVSIVASVLINGARKSEKQQKENVADLLRQSRKQIDALMGDVTKIVTNFPNFDPQAEALLRGRINEYDKLRKKIQNELLKQGDSPLLRAELGRLHIQFGFIQNQLGNFKEALEAYEHAEPIWVDLVEQFPNDIQHKANLAKVLNNLGDVRLEAGLPQSDVLKQYDRALDVLQKVAKADGDDAVDARETRAKIIANKANKLIGYGVYNEADAANRQAMQMFQELAKENPGDEFKYLILTARAANRQMVSLTDRGRSQDAWQFATETLAALETAISEHAQFGQSEGEARDVLAANANDRARTVEPLGRDLDALKSYQAGAAQYDLLNEQYRNSANYLMNLAKCRMNSGRLLQKLGDARAARAESIEAVQAASDALKFFASKEFRLARAQCFSTFGGVLADLGELDNAVNFYEEAISQTSALIAEDDGKNYHRQRAISYGGLARTLWRLDRPAEGVPIVAEAIDVWEKLLAEEAEPAPNYLVGLALLYVTRGDLLFAQQDAAAANDFGRAGDLFGRTVKKFPDSPEYRNAWANFLMTCSDPKLRDAEAGRALELANTASNAVPQNGRYKTTLALAQYRAGSWNDAIAAADDAIRLRQPVESCFDHFIRAMALAKKRDLTGAAESFARANELMDALGPANIDYNRLKNEVEPLLAPPAERNEPKPNGN